ncbi:hypothetical protein QZH41_003223 [Actinostola sp. cb2023]|nr:hypothetical protein QZH41_003223 [Actinostola sp. cb2023]
MAGWDVVFGLNILLRREDDGSWNSSNPLEIMRYVREKGYNFAWELGNVSIPYRVYPGHIVSRNVSLPYRVSPVINVSLPYRVSPVLCLTGIVSIPYHCLPRIVSLPYPVSCLSRIIVSRVSCLSRNVFLTYRVYPVSRIVSIPYPVSCLSHIVSIPYRVSPVSCLSRIVSIPWLDKLGLAARLHHDLVIRQAFFGGRYALLGLDLLPNPIGLKHPIIYDTYDLCDYYRKEKINAFNVAMLKTILSNFEVPYRAKDRKAELSHITMLYSTVSADKS